MEGCGLAARDGIRTARRIAWLGRIVGGRRGMGPRDFGPLERLPVDVQGVVAGRQVPAAVVDKRRLDLLADLRHVAAAGMEAAAGGRIDRARHVALEDDPLSL